MRAVMYSTSVCPYCFLRVVNGFTELRRLERSGELERIVGR
jgi:hypothetical protein